LDDTDENISSEEATVYGHLLVAYGIIEEAFLLYTRKWIDEDTWQQWSAWLAAISSRPQMRRIRERTAGTFDKRFEEYVTKTIKEMEDKKEMAKEASPPKSNST
jgi:predicted RNA polymerase sigma factor